MKRRAFSREFKVSAVQLVQQQSYSIPQAAKNLGVDRTTLRAWVRKFGAELGGDAKPPVTGDAALRAENRQLRKECEQLRMERDILKKATVFFANQQL